MELMTYRLDDESPEEFAARKEDLVVDGAVFLQECGTKVLKLEYPGSEEGCRRVTDAIDVPWAVLSAGVDHEAFCDQLRASMAGGADGFIAGRSLWKEAVGQPADERRTFLDGVARRRMEDLLDDRRRHGLAMRQLLLGIDVGTTYCKALVLDVGGEELGEARERTPWTPVATGAEIDPHGVARTALRRGRAGARRLASGRGGGRRGRRPRRDRRAARPRAASRSGPAIAWHDARGADEARAIAARARRPPLRRR